MTFLRTGRYQPGTAEPRAPYAHGAYECFATEPHVLIPCGIWFDNLFTSLSEGAQWTVFRAVSELADQGFTEFIPQVSLDRIGVQQAAIDELVYSNVWSFVALGYEFIERFGIGIGKARDGRRRAPIPDSLRRAVYARDGWACLHCGATDRLSLDHIHPWSLGGPDTYENLQTLCRPCNSRKGARV